MTSLDPTRQNAGMPIANPSISASEYHAMMAKSMPEKQLQTAIIAQAQRAGWLVYHTFDSRRSEPGYPDLHLVHLGRGLSVFRELKTQTGKLSKQQELWIRALTAAGSDVAVWRPIDFYNGTVSALLLPSSEILR
jgi:hypothetical protein